MNHKQKGNEGEARAATYLEAQGVRILETNYRFHKLGEIDLIGSEQCPDETGIVLPGAGIDVHDRKRKQSATGLLHTYLVFIEVKYRKSAEKGLALEAVSYAKQRQICRVANAYIMEHSIAADTRIRFDVVAIDGEKVTWMKNAFEFID